MKRNNFLFLLLSMFTFFDSYSQTDSKNNDFNDICTVTTAVLLPVKLTTNSLSCATIVDANPFSLIGCKSLFDILSNPIEWWEGNVNNCKVVLSKLRKGDKVETSVTVTGNKAEVDKIISAIKNSSKK